MDRGKNREWNTSPSKATTTNDATARSSVDLELSYVHRELVTLELYARVHYTEESEKIEVRAADFANNALLGNLNDDTAVQAYRAIKQGASCRDVIYNIILPRKEIIGPVFVYWKLSFNSSIVITSTRATNRRYWSDTQLPRYPGSGLGDRIALRRTTAKKMPF
ncbi:hypothetical protein PG985_014911 [Apiospora marii]|uniref:VIT domain-containing protein n=1 Tax=Apiospora marii TaxID=335849 RepID=A0ABR1RIV5_9PEZI